MKINLSTSEIEELKKLLSSKVVANSSEFSSDILSGIFQKVSNDDAVKLFIDGAANLEAKQAGIGGVFYRNEDQLFTFSENIGNATNNEAEYTALIVGLKNSIKLKIMDIDIYSDSELVVKQINGQYKVRNERLMKLFEQVVELLTKFDKWSLSHINREKNEVADKLSKIGMRQKSSATI